MTIRIPTTLAGTRFTTNQSNRLLDIFISQGLDFVDGGPVELKFGDKERTVAGAQKLAQKWFITFLTKKGSVQGDPNYGSDFITNIQLGRIVNDADVRLEFAAAAALVADVLERADSANTNDDEKLQSSELRSFFIDKTQLLMTVRLESQAGAGVEVILPIPLETT